MIRSSTPATLLALAVGTCCTPGIVNAEEWLPLANQTGTRLIAPDHLGIDDEEEKDFAWGDLDNDGDVDLVIVRKQPFTTAGRRINLLLMNEGIADGHAADGVLVDRTEQFAGASDVKGDLGFLTPTNDRDVAFADLNNDGWLDVITAVMSLDSDAPKHISHPRIYINLGEADGQWLGLRHEDARIPTLLNEGGPRFLAVAAGDVTGDGYVDLYFADIDSGGFEQEDLDNRLLVNAGGPLPGVFFDNTEFAMTDPAMSASAFGASAFIADMNNDGANDIVKQTSLSAPLHVGVIYNDPLSVGTFNEFDIVYQLSPYFVSGGDLNNDGLVDIIVTDDGGDRFLINHFNEDTGYADFTQHTFKLANGQNESGFGGNSIATDLNGDGWADVFIADVNDDLPTCHVDRSHIYRNFGPVDGTQPGETPRLQEDDLPIPADDLQGIHDVAAFDLNNDGLVDLVLGTCDGLTIWMQVATCVGDLSGDATIDSIDLLQLLGAWGTSSADLTGDGTTGVADLLVLLGGWGPCD